MQADVRPHMARGITFHGRSNSALRLRATLRVDEKYAADPTSATYRTVSPRARVIQASFWLREAILCSMGPSKKRRRANQRATTQSEKRGHPGVGRGSLLQ